MRSLEREETVRRMFRQLAEKVLTATPGLTPLGAADRVLSLHPMELSRYLEQIWLRRAAPLLAPRGLEVPAGLFQQEGDSNLPANFLPAVSAWNNLIYAYMIENTRVYEIFARVLREFLYGEQLGTADEAGERWLRTTEALFYSDSPPFQIYATTSWLRPDARAMRRNAYYRMFGMDLNHGTDDGGPYPYEKARAANREFVGVFEELLREVWRGIENVQNTSGADPTDDAAIANLALTLDEMLSTRRENGNLNREELWFTSMMSWFHLTLSFDTPIVTTLGAQGAAPEERLMKIAIQVGLPAHGRSHSYFEIADPIAAVIRFIETGQFNTPGTAGTLYQGAQLREAMDRIIAQWSLATGRDMKARKVSVTPATAPAAPPLPSPRPRAVPPVPRPGRASVERDGRPIGAPMS
jgi:hypothetical protein